MLNVSSQLSHSLFSDLICCQKWYRGCQFQSWQPRDVSCSSRKQPDLCSSNFITSAKRLSTGEQRM